jgi:hypothetical protein
MFIKHIADERMVSKINKELLKSTIFKQTIQLKIIQSSKQTFKQIIQIENKNMKICSAS